jgi:hypothetical protein
MAAERPATVSQQIDNDLARSALAKRGRGESPSAGERSALRRVEAAKEEALRWAFYASIPKTHWQQLSGRQPKILNEQSARYGLPVGGKRIDLGQVAVWLHNFLAKHGRRIFDAGDDPLLCGADSPALERYRGEKAILAKLDRQEKQRRLLPREVIHEALMRTAAILRKTGELLQKNHGPEAARLLSEALEDCQREFDALCLDGTDPDQPWPDPDQPGPP